MKEKKNVELYVLMMEKRDVVKKGGSGSPCLPSRSRTTPALDKYCRCGNSADVGLYRQCRCETGGTAMLLGTLSFIRCACPSFLPPNVSLLDGFESILLECKARDGPSSML